PSRPTSIDARAVDFHRRGRFNRGGYPAGGGADRPPRLKSGGFPPSEGCAVNVAPLSHAGSIRGSHRLTSEPPARERLDRIWRRHLPGAQCELRPITPWPRPDAAASVRVSGSASHTGLWPPP